MREIFKQYNLEQRINFMFTDAAGAGYRYPEVEEPRTYSLDEGEFEVTVFQCDGFQVESWRDLDQNIIVDLNIIDVWEDDDELNFDIAEQEPDEKGTFRLGSKSNIPYLGSNFPPTFYTKPFIGRN